MNSLSAHPDQSRAALLELGTQLAGGAWSVVVAPDVGEASGCYVRPSSASHRDIQDEDETASWWQELSEAERALQNEARALRRARKRMRQFSIQNKLTHLWTLTYRCVECDGDPCWCGSMAGPADRQTVKRDVANFLKRLRRALGPDSPAFPYLYVIERGSKSTKRLHVHLLLPAGFTANTIQGSWSLGRTDHSRPPGSHGQREQARRCAGYLTKYLAKSLRDEDPAWSHSYERAQGFNVRQVRRRLGAADDVLWFIAQHLTQGQGDLLSVSASVDWDDYDGPPAFFVRERPPDG